VKNGQCFYIVSWIINVFCDDIHIDSSLRLTREQSFLPTEIRTKPLALGYLEVNDSSVEEAENPGLDTVLHVGDRVCVFLPAEELKGVQRGRGGWSMRMIEVIMS
jgi:hypothetical protein